MLLYKCEQNFSAKKRENGKGNKCYSKVSNGKTDSDHLKEEEEDV